MVPFGFAGTVIPAALPHARVASDVLEALEDALLEFERSGSAPGLRDELATVIRVIHRRLGLDEGGL